MMSFNCLNDCYAIQHLRLLVFREILNQVQGDHVITRLPRHTRLGGIPRNDGRK